MTSKLCFITDTNLFVQVILNVLIFIKATPNWTLVSHQPPMSPRNNQMFCPFLLTCIHTYIYTYIAKDTRLVVIGLFDLLQLVHFSCFKILVF